MFREAGRHTGSWEDVQIGREIYRLTGKGTGSQAERYKSRHAGIRTRRKINM
jgi:hypothetical protein